MKPAFLKKCIAMVLSVVLLLCLFACTPAGSEPPLTKDFSVSFAYQKAELNAPLRGIALWNTAAAQPVPYSLEYLPIPLHQLVTQNGGYDFSYSDAQLDKIASRGNHTILRFVLWEPPSVYLPDAFLQAGVKTVSVENITVPDFSDEMLIDKLCEFISAAGTHYDGDPRIGFLQLGLIGRWGEWNYGSDYPPGHIPSNEQYNKIYAAFDAAFRITKLQARNPNLGSPNVYAIGYHDDNFMFSTLGNGGGDFRYLCETGGIANDLWKTESFGAELSGNEAGDFFSTEEKRMRFINSVQYQNFSFMMWQRYDSILDTDLWNTNKDAALELTRSLGYELYIRRAWLTRAADGAVLTAEIQNTGNAPFYYDWDSTVQLYKDNELILTKTKNWKLSELMPGETKAFTVELSDNGNRAPDVQSYDSVFLSIENPLSQFSQNAKAFRFANQTEDLTNGKLCLYARSDN